jgi:hypothetical protein
MLFSPGGGGAGILSYTQAQRDALTPSNGTVIFNTTSLRVQQYDSTTLLWRNVGDPLSINYITNYNAESSAQGWATYADAAQATPVDGTGGSPTVTFGVSSTTPLRNGQDFNFVKDAANRQGEGFSYNFSIDRADQGRVLSINFDYEVISGTFASGDLTCWVYDVTNAVLLPQPSGNSIISTSIPSQQGQCTFQTAINSTSYRLIFHVTSTSASAYTLAFDNISVGPQVSASGSVNTALVNAGVMTIGAVTTPPTKPTSMTQDTVFWERQGDMGYFKYFYRNAASAGSAAGSGAYLYSLPTGLSFNTTFVTVNTSGTTTDDEAWRGWGVGGLTSDGVSHSQSVWMVPYSATQFRILVSNAAAATFFIGSGNLPTTTANFGFELEFTVPIAGWASNNVLSTSANTKPVVFTGTQTSQAVTANVTNITFTATKDSVAGWATNIYTVAVPGDYDVSMTYASASSPTTVVYKNGSSFQNMNSVNNSQQSSSIIVPNLIVGDTISVRSNGSVTITSGYLSIALRQSPQQIAASEPINARYFASSTSISGSLATIVWTTKDFDTHNAMASGVYTVPAPGKYQVNSNIQTAGTIALNTTVDMQLQKNGTAVSELQTYAGGAMTAQNGQISDIITCATGDTIRIQLSSSATLPTITASNSKVFFSIARVGS